MLIESFLSVVKVESQIAVEMWVLDLDSIFIWFLSLLWERVLVSVCLRQYSYVQIDVTREDWVRNGSQKLFSKQKSLICKRGAAFKQKFETPAQNSRLSILIKV